MKLLFKLFSIKKNKIFKKECSSLNANLYWEFAVSIIIVSTFIFLIVGFFIFREINKELLIYLDSNNKITSQKQEKLDSILKYYLEKKDNSQKIIQLPSPVQDPSL